MMKEQNEMDRILRDSLGSFRPEPDPASRKKFLDEASSVVGRKRGGGSGWVRITVGLIAILITGTLIYTAIFDQEPSVSRSDSAVVPNPDDDSRPSGSHQNRPASKNTLTAGNMQNVEPSHEMGRDEERAEYPASSKIRLSENLAKTDETPGSPGGMHTTDAGFPAIRFSLAKNDVPLAGITSLQNFTLVYLRQAEEGIKDNDVRIISPPAATPDRPERVSPHASYGVYYKPDMMFRIIDDNKVVHSAGAEVQVRFSDPRFLVRTGLGFSFSKGFNEYNVNYNEYLGSYLRLDSVTFSLGENNFDLIAQIHQTEQLVYDTAVEALPAKTYQRFTYLQVPLTGGYDFLSWRNLTVGARLGAVMSVLLSSNLGQVNYDAGNNQVIGVDQLTPERELLNWQALAGVTFTLRGPKRSYIELEPAFSYYLNAIHQEAAGPEHPYSIGLRLAVGIK